MKKYNGKIPLIVEPHPENYNGYEFVTLIKFNDENFLTIVDNVYNKQIVSYVLDLCPLHRVDEQLVLTIANDWFQNNKDLYPISIEFSKLGLSKDLSNVVRCFPIDYVTRVIGPLPTYKMNGPIKIKKRKRKSIPKNIELITKLQY